MEWITYVWYYDTAIKSKLLKKVLTFQRTVKKSTINETISERNSSVAKRRESSKL